MKITATKVRLSTIVSIGVCLAAGVASGALVGPDADTGRGGGVQARRPVEAVRELDLGRYAGLWYEIARFPNRFQNDCAGDVTARYALRADGRIDVINACTGADGERTEAAGIARLASKDGPASELKVRFAPKLLTWIPWVWADYWVVALDDDYRYAAVGTPNRDYLWILSRTPQMDDAVLAEITGELAAMGFEIERLEPTTQTDTAVR